MPKKKQNLETKTIIPKIPKGLSYLPSGWSPSIGVPVPDWESKRGFIQKIKMPGFKPEEISVDINNGNLEINIYEKLFEKKISRGGYSSEYLAPKMYANFPLPKELENLTSKDIKTEYKNNILTIYRKREEKKK